MVVPFNSFDDFVTTLQAQVWPTQRTRRFESYLTRTEHVQRLLAAVDGGLELTPRTVHEVIKLGGMPTIGAEHFRAQPHFDDDRYFTPTRFLMVFAYHQLRMPHDMAVMPAAHAQVTRMLIAGRMSPVQRYVQAYLAQVLAQLVSAGGEVQRLALLAAHYPDVWALMERRLAATAHNAGRYGSNAEETDAMMYEQSTRTLVAAAVLREEMFRDYWLKAALGMVEWREMRELALPVLQGLYAEVWTAGYAGYHQRMRNDVEAWVG